MISLFMSLSLVPILLTKRKAPNFKKIVLCNTGSEAVIKSLRISRAINKKKKIVNIILKIYLYRA